MKNQKQQPLTHSSVVGYVALVAVVIGVVVAAHAILSPMVSGIVGNVGALLAGGK